ncbi:DUF5787 family protein [Natrinema hispanicum]|uniref:Uncharacterized protein n=1 Tax=Natrinema hispanicum TaxID=392421 RepID=A0A1I0AB58_9EURY|nr:DUF5787 family protein [Natrinema hispanicum]SDB98808.1 hypothetical protein SAMN05192552_100146 [Natrinema hispanicum]SES91424.1 hypothetical protein SAMN04488694_102303 [Natrinema hispanicum]
MSEFAFELELCTHLESRREGIIARQLGASVAEPGGRILDIVCVEPGPAFDERVAITNESIPDAAIASAVGTGRARYWKAAFDCHPDRARRAVDRALEIGFFERDHTASADANREYVRQTVRYPDWYDRIVGIENKPDLGRPGDLEAQLRTDVSLAVVDEIVLATESYVTRAHLNRLPEEVGVWRVHRDDTDHSLEIEVIREPSSLPVDEPGVEPLAFQPGRTDIEIVSPQAKARARRRLAERAYGKGWRTYEFPACGACQPADKSGATLPYCVWANRVVDAATECGPSCPGYEPATAPGVDLEDERDRQTAWEADPDGTRRRQAGLDQFG